jgi:hypothetical protein
VTIARRPAFQPIQKIPGFEKFPGAERALLAQLNAIKLDLHEALDRARTTELLTTDYMAREGESVRCSPGTGGMTVILPRPRPENDNTRIAIMLESVTRGQLTVQCIGGQVNRLPTITLTTPGLVELVCNGIDGWVSENAPGTTGPGSGTGPRGERGSPGQDGLEGLRGGRGPVGLPGTAGARGSLGAPGLDGADGTPGRQGVPGAPGARGGQGPRGSDGESLRGPVGQRGPKGDKGDRGPPGRPGIDGDVGPRGPGLSDSELTWSRVLARGNRSGTNDAIIDSTQSLIFGTAAASGGQIESANAMVITTDAELALHGETTAILSADTIAALSCSVAGGGEVQALPSGVTQIAAVAAGSGFLRMIEASASTPSNSAGRGLFWVRDDTPNVSMFTDDANVDHKMVADDYDVTWTGDHAFSAATTFSAAALFSGDIQLNAVISPTVTADQNNWNPSGFDTCSVVRTETDATPRTVTGMVPPSDNGHLRFFFNTGAANLVFAHQSASSTDVNRIVCPNGASLTLSVNDGVIAWYDFASNRWRLVGI